VPGVTQATVAVAAAMSTPTTNVWGRGWLPSSLLLYVHACPTAVDRPGLAVWIRGRGHWIWSRLSAPRVVGGTLTIAVTAAGGAWPHHYPGVGVPSIRLSVSEHISNIQGGQYSATLSKEPIKWKLINMVDCAKENGLITDLGITYLLRQERNNRAHGSRPSLVERRVLLNSAQYIAGMYIDYILLEEYLNHV
jgi:hypothetical protein